MAKETKDRQQITGDSVQRPYKGLHQDNSPEDQPEGTYRFALNSINKNNKNQRELGNINYTKLTKGFVPIGKVYIGDGETAIFSVKNSVSEIGVLDGLGNYTVHVNDHETKEKEKLNFKVEHQIQAVYRLRRGCEKTIYFIFKNSRPLFYNFNKKEDFQNSYDREWNVKLFYLQKHYDRIPKFDQTEVLDTGGNILPGSYNIAIQYIDGSFNPTEWIKTSGVIMIYNDSLSLSYEDINGSINSEADYFDFPHTDKAIRVKLSNLDSNFLYYRLAFVEANIGTGIVNSVKYTEAIPTTKDYFIYTGENYKETGSEAEIAAFSDIIESAESIEQIQNMLILANTTGSQIDFCKLQRYASKINADCVLKEVNLSSVEASHNPKSPTHKIDGVFYMPGEIYSFGVVYILEGNVFSPVCHIPGKNPAVGSNVVFSPKSDSKGKMLTYGMSNINKSESYYTSRNSCDFQNYWGKDGEGISLEGKNIRHHRFPLRSEINIPLIKTSEGASIEQESFQLLIKVKGDLKTSVFCEPDEAGCTPITKNPFSIKVVFRNEGTLEEFTQTIDPDRFSFGGTTYNIDLEQVSKYYSLNDFDEVEISISDASGDFHVLPLVNNTATYTNDNGDYFQGNATITTSVISSISTIKGNTYRSDMFGIKFSNIQIPDEKEIGGKVIGYFIVRNERTEFDKTILDTGVITPSVTNDKYISHGLLAPVTDRISDSVYGIIHPEHKFHDRKYVDYDEMLQEGVFKITDSKHGKVNFDDVFEGSSFESKRQKSGNDDGEGGTQEAYTRGYDGFSLNIISRDSVVEYEPKRDFKLSKEDFKERFYLSALDSRTIDGGEKEVYNIAADNKIGMFQLGEDRGINMNNSFPYVILKRNNLDSYPNFRVLPYYPQTENPSYFADGEDTVEVFGGDTYVAPMRYVNSVFWNNRVARRAGRSSALTIIVGAIIAVVGAVLAIWTGGSTLVLTGIGIAMIGGGTLLISSGIKQENWNKLYGREYDKGLRKTALDDWVETFYEYKANVGDFFRFPWTGQTAHAGEHAKDGPSDDTIQWIGDCITDLWFETSVNMSIRTKMSSDVPNFLSAPGIIESGQDSPIALWEFFKIHYADSNQRRYPVSALENHLAKKLLAFSPERNEGKVYIGIALGEFYHMNPDYLRNNTQKTYFHLPLEYDCCSDCQEEFPQRWRWTQQSFQEELTDNYRTFLPNNYRDLEGETGKIVNVFTMSDKLYLHSQEGLWQVPKNHQERVTDEIVSFIGTGSYFDIPPIKIIDSDTGNSAGIQHKWAAKKTEFGYFFITENQKTVYEFDGQKLSPISDVGLREWFKNSLTVEADQEYKKMTNEDYPFRDNPSNKYGTGFTLGYDSAEKRLLITKKDFNLSKSLSLSKDSRVTFFNGNLIIFRNFKTILAQQTALGRSFVGIEDGQLVFSYDETEMVEVSSYDWVPPIIYYSPIHYKTWIKGRFPGDDPKHPKGVVVYKAYPSGDIITLDHFVNETCEPLLNFEIISHQDCIMHCQPEEKIGGEATVVQEGYYTHNVKLVESLVTKYVRFRGDVVSNPVGDNKSWTISYSLSNLKEKFWMSWHSYIPNFYIDMSERLFSWLHNKPAPVLTQKSKPVLTQVKVPEDVIWEHNKGIRYGNFYGLTNDYVIEYVSNNNPMVTHICNHLRLSTTALRFNKNTNEYYEDKLITFNKAIVYNSRQCSGLLELQVKEGGLNEEDFMVNQIINNDKTIIDRNEDDWFINDLRDIRVNYNDSIWNSNTAAVQDNYYIDKVLNVDALDYDKNWEELENFRGKYLIVRFILSKKEDVNLMVNYFSNNETISNGN